MNHEARQRVEAQIRDKIHLIHSAIVWELKAGLDILEMARCSAGTESMMDVAALLRQAAEKFDIAFHRDSKTLQNLAGVAQQVHESEMELMNELKPREMA